MACFAGPKTPYSLLNDGTAGFFCNPNVLSSLFADTSGTIPATVDNEVKRMNDLGPLGVPFISPTGSRVINGVTYIFHGPTLRKNGDIYYLEFDGEGAGLEAMNITANWPQATSSGESAMSLMVAFETSSTQPIGFGGTWLGTHSIGNFTSKWNFGLRLSLENQHYCVVRNDANDGWLTIFDEGSRYSNINLSQYYDNPIIYYAEGNIENMTIGGKDYIKRDFQTEFSNVAITDTENDLPIDLYNNFAIGARAPSNDNWIAGNFYGGMMISKSLTDSERNSMYNYFYSNINK